MAASNFAKYLLLAAVTLAIASTITFTALAWRENGRASVVPPVLSGHAYTAVVVDLAAIKTGTWQAPAALARGPDWIYDVFTPPEIFYNSRTRQFVVTPPASFAGDAVEIPFGLELIAVKRDPFRLQLIGHVGGEGEGRGIFENLHSGEVFLAKAGDRVTNLALSITEFSVRLEPVAIPDSMTVNQRIAIAVVRDDRSHQDVTLTQRERKFTGSVFALVASSGEPSTREVRPGDAFQLGRAVYRVEKISLDPATIEVTKTAPELEVPDRRTLSLLVASSASTSP